MKALIAMILAVLMLIPSVFASCEEGPLPGGWIPADDTSVTEETFDLLNRALGKISGVSWMPIAYLGSQVVAGTNHCLLCTKTVVYPGAVPQYVLLYLHEDLDGNVSILKTAPLDLGAMYDAPAQSKTEPAAEKPDYLAFTLGSAALRLGESALEDFRAEGFEFQGQGEEDLSFIFLNKEEASGFYVWTADNTPSSPVVAVNFLWADGIDASWMGIQLDPALAAEGGENADLVSLMKRTFNAQPDEEGLLTAVAGLRDGSALTVVSNGASVSLSLQP